MENTGFKMIMISAMYENGGNTTHRLLDGHPELFVYPFESQLGTKYVNDFLSGMFPLKYRWPVFPCGISAEDAYQLIIDEECKIRSLTPFVSKFRNVDFEMGDDDRKTIFIDQLRDKQINSPNAVAAFFTSTFQAWKNYSRSGNEKVYVGYSPVIGIDGHQIIADLNRHAYVLHIVRNPFSAFAETKKRPVPLSLNHYITAWNICQHFAEINQEKYTDNFFILRYEDIIEDPRQTLSKFLQTISLSDSPSLCHPSWNNVKLETIYPWGTIKIATRDANFETAATLNPNEIADIYLRSRNYIEKFHYDDFIRNLGSR
jgi:hypothetical protein